MIVRQFASFTAIGAIGTLAHYSALIGMVQFMHISPVPASGAGFVIGGLVNYTLNYRLTFRSTKLHRQSMPRFFIVAAIGLVLNTALMALLAELLRLHYLLAQVLTTGCLLLWHFGANRYWTFR